VAELNMESLEILLRPLVFLFYLTPLFSFYLIEIYLFSPEELRKSYAITQVQRLELD